MNTQSQSPTPVSVIDLLEAVRRRKYYALVAAALVFVGASAYTISAKDRFRARALIASQPSTEPNYVDPAARVRDQLHVVREVLFGETVFDPVVQQFGLLKTTHGNPQRAIEEIKTRIKIEFDGENAFYVGYESEDRRTVADVANQLAQRLVAQTSERRERRTEQETEVVDGEVNRLHSKLEDLDSRIQQYKQRSVEELPERVAENLKLVEGLQSELRETASALASEDARRAGIVAEMTGLERQGVNEIPEPPVKSPNQEKLDSARIEFDKLRARGYTKEHPELIRLKGEIAALETLVASEPPRRAARTVSPSQLRLTQLKAELETIDRRLVSLRQAKDALNSQLGDYRQRANAAPRHEQALTQLSREYNITKGQYEAQLARQLDGRKNTQLEKINNSVVFRIVEPARTPLDPFSPNRIRLLAIGILASIGFSLSIVFLLEHVDSTFKDVEEFQAQTGLSVLSIVPKIELSAPVAGGDGPTSGSSSNTSCPVATIVTLADRKSIASEQFQILATRLQRRAAEHGCSVLMVTSSAGGEGKTVASVNLAVALSGGGSRVLLIDADLRRPRVHSYLGLHVQEGLGLCGLLSDPGGDIERYARKVRGLMVLPGQLEGENALKILSSPGLRSLLERLRERFQFIVIDSPPILPIADGLVLGDLSDHVVMVVRAHRTTRVVLRRAMDALDMSKLAGVILNDVDTRHSRYAYVYRYYENTYLRGA